MNLDHLTRGIFEAAAWQSWTALCAALDYGWYPDDAIYPWYGMTAQESRNPMLRNAAICLSQGE